MASYAQDPAFWSLAAVALGSVGLTVRVSLKAKRREKGLTEKLAQAEAKAEEAAREVQEVTDGKISTVLKSAMQTLRLLAAEQQVKLDELQREYGGHKILQPLLEVNHANAQFARRALGIAVLCGGFSGRRKEPASVYDVIRSAQGQISQFDRVKIRDQSGFAVMPSAVDGVALAVAELLANAASYSPPGTTIEVNLQPVQRGLCIVIDDAGVGMSEEAKQRAAALFSGEYRPGLSELGNPPQFGFPVVAELARRFGFHTDVSTTSPWGGVRAIVRLPETLLTTERIERRSTLTVDAVPHSAPGEQPASERTANGLPKRGARKAPIALVRTPRVDDRPTVPAAPAAPAEPAEQDSRVTAARMAAFQQGTRTGRQPIVPSQEGQES